MEYVLRTNALTKKYKKFEALKGLSMNVPKGSIYGFVGRNGAGKTTLFRIICGLQFSTSGEFNLFGTNSNDAGILKARNRMGAIVEAPSLFPEMTARENLEHQYKLLGMPNFDGISELLSLVGLENTQNKKTKNFSLGMRQRLGIAVALCGNQDFLMLDEPINGLDPQGIIEMRELILKLNREKGITFLISSHILDELAKLATYYGFIDSGKMVREMSADEIEDACHKSLKVNVSSTAALARVLDKMSLEYKILSDNDANIYARPGISELVTALDKEGCKLNSCSEQEETLEGFFISLVGGGSNE